MFMNHPHMAQALLTGLETLPNGFYWDSTLAPTKAQGYIQLSAVGANKFTTLNEMLGWAAGLYLERGGDQYSHRCNNPRCTVASHICVESAVLNNGRKGCRVWVDCPHEGCGKKIRVCAHEPSCIRYCPGFDSWEDFEARGFH
jgi:hypothetical protein